MPKNSKTKPESACAKKRREKLEAVAKEIHDFPLYAVQNTAGGEYIGEVVKLKTGEWEARRYGSNYLNDRALYPNEHQALAFFNRADIAMRRV